MVAVASIAALLHYETEEDILYVAKEVVVPVTRAKAFLFIADMSNYRRWHVGIDDFVPVDESIMGIGKVFTETSRVAVYGNVSYTCTILGYEPPRFLSYTCDNWLTRPRIEIELKINEDNPRYPTSVFWREFSRRRSYFFNYLSSHVVSFIYGYIRRQALFSLRFLLQDQR